MQRTIRPLHTYKTIPAHAGHLSLIHIYHLDVDAKAELKRALLAYKGSILMVCHEPEFYEDLVTDVWDCTKWTTRVF